MTRHESLCRGRKRGTTTIRFPERHSSTPMRASRAMTRERRPGGEHTRKRAVFRELGNGPYRRRESFDADASAREMATMRAETKRDDDEGSVALTRERERIEARESEVRASMREKRRMRTRDDDSMRAWMNE